nr:MAG TPA: hypothetical protein [Caudoviricetes sp.]
MLLPYMDTIIIYQSKLSKYVIKICYRLMGWYRDLLGSDRDSQDFQGRKHRRAQARTGCKNYDCKQGVVAQEVLCGRNLAGAQVPRRN